MPTQSYFKGFQKDWTRNIRRRRKRWRGGGGIEYGLDCGWMKRGGEGKVYTRLRLEFREASPAD